MSHDIRTFDKISVFRKIVHSLGVISRGDELVLISSSDYSLVALRLPRFGSRLSQPSKSELRCSTGHLITRGNTVVYSEMKQLHLARVADKLESTPLMTLRHDLIQMDTNESTLLVATEMDIMVTPLGKCAPVSLVTVAHMAPSIRGACYTQTAGQIAYCDESGHVRIIDGESGVVTFDASFGYHTGLVPGKMVSSGNGLCAFNANTVSFIDMDKDDVDTVTIRGRITTLLNADTLIAISSGYAYHYLSEPRVHKKKELKDEGVELAAAINSAKGFLFGLKKALGSRVAETVEELKREIYDDEIYVEHEQSKEAREIEQALEAVDDDDDQEKLEVERKIRPKVAKKKKDSKTSTKSASIPSVSTPSFDVVDSDDGIDWNRDREVIEDALVEAFQKLDTDFEPNAKPVRHIPLADPLDEAVLAQSPQSTSSWTVVEEEYDEI